MALIIGDSFVYDIDKLSGLEIENRVSSNDRGLFDLVLILGSSARFYAFTGPRSQCDSLMEYIITDWSYTSDKHIRIPKPRGFNYGEIREHFPLIIGYSEVYELRYTGFCRVALYENINETYNDDCIPDKIAEFNSLYGGKLSDEVLDKLVKTGCPSEYLCQAKSNYIQTYEEE